MPFYNMLKDLKNDDFKLDKNYMSGYVTLMPKNGDSTIKKTVIWFHQDGAHSVDEYKDWT